MTRLKLFPTSLVPSLSSLPWTRQWLRPTLPFIPRSQHCLKRTSSRLPTLGPRHPCFFSSKQLTLVVPPAAVYVHTASHTAPFSCGDAHRDTRSVSYLSSLPAPDPGLHPAM